MYAPDALNSFASVGSTRVILPVTFLALSLGTKAPHWLQLTVPELPLPPFDLPLLALFFGIYCVRFDCYALNLVLNLNNALVLLTQGYEICEKSSLSSIESNFVFLMVKGSKFLTCDHVLPKVSAVQF
jgi:hypothetical protein